MITTGTTININKAEEDLDRERSDQADRRRGEREDGKR